MLTNVSLYIFRNLERQFKYARRQYYKLEFGNLIFDFGSQCIEIIMTNIDVSKTMLTVKN